MSHLVADGFTAKTVCPFARSELVVGYRTVSFMLDELPLGACIALLSRPDAGHVAQDDSLQPWN